MESITRRLHYVAGDNLGLRIALIARPTPAAQRIESAFSAPVTRRATDATPLLEDLTVLMSLERPIEAPTDDSEMVDFQAFLFVLRKMIDLRWHSAIFHDYRSRSRPTNKSIIVLAQNAL